MAETRYDASSEASNGMDSYATGTLEGTGDLDATGALGRTGSLGRADALGATGELRTDEDAGYVTVSAQEDQYVTYPTEHASHFASTDDALLEDDDLDLDDEDAPWGDAADETQLADAAETQLMGAGQTVLSPLPVRGSEEALIEIASESDEDSEAFQALKELEERRAQRRRSKFIKIGIAAGAIALAVGGFFAINSMAAKPTEEVTYQTATVERTDFTISVQGTGALQPASQVVVTPEMDGIIDSVSVGEGQYVREGDILFTLRNSELEKSISDAEETLRKAQEEVDRAYEERGKAERARDEARAAYDRAVAAADDANRRAREAYDNAYRSAYDRSKADSGNAIPAAEQAVSSAQDAANTAQAALDQAKTAMDEAKQRADASKQDPVTNNQLDLDKAYNDAVAEYNRRQDELAAAQAELANKQSELAVLRDGVEAKADEAGRAAGEAEQAKVPIPEVPVYDETIYTSAIDATNSTIIATEATRDTAQRALDQEVEKRGKLTIRAPKNGTLISLAAVVGASVGNVEGAAAAGSAHVSGSLATVADITEMHVSLQINEVDISSVKAGQRAKVTFSSIPGLEEEARVIDVASVASGSGDGSGGGVAAFAVDCVIPRPDSRLKPGMTATVTIYTTDVPAALVLPAGAVRELSTGTFVDVVTNPEALLSEETPAAQPETERVKVKVGPSTSSQVVIESGVSLGDVVLLDDMGAGAGKSLDELTEEELMAMSEEEITALMEGMDETAGDAATSAETV